MLGLPCVTPGVGLPSPTDPTHREATQGVAGYLGLLVLKSQTRELGRSLQCVPSASQLVFQGTLLLTAYRGHEEVGARAAPISLPVPTGAWHTLDPKAFRSRPGCTGVMGEVCVRLAD